MHALWAQYTVSAPATHGGLWHCGHCVSAYTKSLSGQGVLGIGGVCLRPLSLKYARPPQSHRSVSSGTCVSSGGDGISQSRTGAGTGRPRGLKYRVPPPLHPGKGPVRSLVSQREANCVLWMTGVLRPAWLPRTKHLTNITPANKSL